MKKIIISIENLDEILKSPSLIPFLESLKQFKSDGIEVEFVGNGEVVHGLNEMLLKSYEDFNNQ